MGSRHICAPNQSPGSDQASKTLFRGNAEKGLTTLALLGRLCRDGRVDWLLRQVKIALAAAIPIDLINLRVIFHSPYNVMKKVFSAGYRSVGSGRPLILTTVALR